MIKVCAISDMHGQYGFDIEPCDILCICGDIVPLKVQTFHNGTKKFIRKVFIPWCDKQPCEKVYLIAGNHDWVFQTHEADMRSVLEGTKITYLKDELAVYSKDEQAIRIYGTPWCHRFYDWAFMDDDEELKVKYDNIPENVDILMTHDCSYGACDALLQPMPWNNLDHIGCRPLAEAVIEKRPRFQLSGHLHTGSHEFEQLGETMCRNVSMLDEEYNMSFKPTYFEI